MKIERIKAGIDNVYLLRNDKGTILIDAGYPGKAKTLDKALKKNNIMVGDISLVILTHAHWDHIGNTKYLSDVWKAKIAVHHIEAGVVKAGTVAMPPGRTTWGRLFGVFLSVIAKNYTLPKCEVDIHISDDGMLLKDFGFQGRVLHTPGHSDGSVSIIFESGEAFVGDCAMNGFPLTMSPGLPIFATNEGALGQSWQKIIQSGAKTIFPAHGGKFHVSIIEKELEEAFNQTKACLPS